jgi:hypothetical protein
MKYDPVSVFRKSSRRSVATSRPENASTKRNALRTARDGEDEAFGSAAARRVRTWSRRRASSTRRRRRRTWKQRRLPRPPATTPTWRRLPPLDTTSWCLTRAPRSFDERGALYVFAQCHSPWSCRRFPSAWDGSNRRRRVCRSRLRPSSSLRKARKMAGVRERMPARDFQVLMHAGFFRFSLSGFRRV